MDVAEVVADLIVESAEVDGLVADLPATDWGRQTPAAGWTIGHQIAHLAWTDRAALLAVQDPAAFQAHLETAVANPGSFVDDGAKELLDEPATLFARWRDGRSQLARALVALPSGSKVLWYGTAMSPTSMATARIMETWAHGLDIADALGVRRQPTARLRHIAHLGHRTLGYSFLARGLQMPS
jgi:uncharacterized protein (TIGR03084 family)